MDMNLIAQVITIIIGVIIAIWAGGQRLFSKIVEILRHMADISLAQQRFFAIAADALEDGRVTEQELRQILEQGNDWLDKLKALISLLSSKEKRETTITTQSTHAKSGEFVITKIWLKERTEI